MISPTLVTPGRSTWLPQISSRTTGWGQMPSFSQTMTKISRSKVSPVARREQHHLHFSLLLTSLNAPSVWVETKHCLRMMAKDDGKTLPMFVVLECYITRHIFEPHHSKPRSLHDGKHVAPSIPSPYPYEASVLGTLTDSMWATPKFGSKSHLERRFPRSPLPT